MSNRPFWEELYGQLDAPDPFGVPSKEFTDLVRWMPRGSSVLDLGCGSGRNALFLAGRGLDVSAVDISPLAVRKLQHRARRNGLQIKAWVHDLRTLVLDGSYDLIIAHGWLHLLEREHWGPLLDQMKRYTSQGGYNVVTVFTDELPPVEEMAGLTLGLFREGELYEWYDEWEIVLRRSYIKDDRHGDGSPHQHPINKIVARKR